MNLLVQCVWIGAGGFLGAIARYLVVISCGRIFGTGFPTGTMVANITGSVLLGWFAAFAANRMPAHGQLYLAVATGFIGAYTTFSTLMFESSKQIGDGEAGKAITNIVASLALGLLAIRVGMWMGGR